MLQDIFGAKFSVDTTAPNLQPQTLTGVYLSKPTGIEHFRSFATRDEARACAYYVIETLYAVDLQYIGVWLGNHPAHNTEREALSTFEYGNDADVQPERIGA